MERQRKSITQYQYTISNSNILTVHVSHLAAHHADIRERQLGNDYILAFCNGSTRINTQLIEHRIA